MGERLNVNGVFDQETQEQAREWLNDNWEKAGFRKKKLSGSSFGKGSIKALQTFLNSEVPGCSLTIDGKDSSVTVKFLRKFLNNNWKVAGFREKKLALSGKIKDGLENNPGTVKALQTLLNNIYHPAEAAQEESEEESETAPAPVQAKVRALFSWLVGLRTVAAVVSLFLLRFISCNSLS